MEIVITIQNGLENISKSGSIRSVFDLTRTSDYYLANGQKVQFLTVEEFRVVSGSRNRKRVEFIAANRTYSLTCSNGVLVAKPLEEDDDTINTEVTWTRECIFDRDRFHTPVEVQGWVKTPLLSFANREQYVWFMDVHSQDCAEILNKLYTTRESTHNTSVQVKLAHCLTGTFAGKLAVVNGGIVRFIHLVDGELYESRDFHSKSDLGIFIPFTLRFGLSKYPDREIQANLLIGGFPGVSQETKIASKQWVPHYNQYVRIDGMDDVYVISEYRQETGRFILIIADLRKREEDMIKNKADQPRKFFVDTARLRPVVIDY